MAICNGEFFDYSLNCRPGERIVLSGYDAKFSLNTDTLRSCDGPIDLSIAKSPDSLPNACVSSETSNSHSCLLDASLLSQYFKRQVGNGLEPNLYNSLPKRIEIRYICSSKLLDIYDFIFKEALNSCKLSIRWIVSIRDGSLVPPYFSGHSVRSIGLYRILLILYLLIWCYFDNFFYEFLKSFTLNKNNVKLKIIFLIFIKYYNPLGLKIPKFKMKNTTLVSKVNNWKVKNTIWIYSMILGSCACWKSHLHCGPRWDYQRPGQTDAQCHS